MNFFGVPLGPLKIKKRSRNGLKESTLRTNI